MKYKTFPLRIHKIKISKPKWYDNGHAMPWYVYTRHLQKFCQVLSSHHSLLAVQVSLCLLSFGVAWSISSYAQGLWHSGTLDLCSCSGPAPVCLPSGPCAALWIYLGSGSLDSWLPWLVRVVEQNVVGDKLGPLLGWWGGGALQYLYIVAFAAGPKI